VINAAVDRVATHRRVEFRLVSGVPHTEVRRALAEADVVVDQLRSASASVLALEAMSAGAPVLSRVDERALASFHYGLPVVPVTAETLEEELERLLDDAERCRALGEQGRAYVLKTHAAERVAEAMQLVYEHARTAPPGLYEATADGIAERSD
jgi:glycosyltransferase involved in cell wall biosynthesis